MTEPKDSTSCTGVPISIQSESGGFHTLFARYRHDTARSRGYEPILIMRKTTQKLSSSVYASPIISMVFVPWAGRSTYGGAPRISHTAANMQQAWPSEVRSIQTLTVGVAFLRPHQLQQVLSHLGSLLAVASFFLGGACPSVCFRMPTSLSSFLSLALALALLWPTCSMAAPTGSPSRSQRIEIKIYQQVCCVFFFDPSDRQCVASAGLAV